jgi:hypothetical protein
MTARTRELSSPPSLTSLYPKVLLGMVGGPVLRRLPGVGGAELPDTELLVSDVEIDRERLTSYDRVCGFRLRDELPATYPHLLAFPMSMELMTDPSFPFSVLGLVHIQNRITQRRPLRLGEPVSLRVRLGSLARHERGTQFEVLAEASVAGEPTWESASTYLRRERGGDGGGRGERGEPPEPDAIWEVPGDIGRRYGAVSGDRNPIHLHGLTARLFGLARPIAHGMWLKARCLAALEGTLPDAFTVEVRFKLPLFLPARAAFSSRSSDGATEFAVHDASSGKPHLEGAITTVSS